MKKVVVAAGFLASLVLASNTYADAFSAVDYLKGSYDISSDCGLLKLAKCEESKIEAFLGGDYGGVKQIQTEDGAGWLSSPNNANIVSFDLSAFGLLLSNKPTILPWRSRNRGNAASRITEVCAFPSGLNTIMLRRSFR